MDRMKETLQPAFTDVTWGAGGSTADLSLQLALYAHQTGHCSNMHLTCTNIQHFTGDPKQSVQEALQAAFDGGIRNLVALRGDPPAGENEWKITEGGFSCALDLVVFIREKFGNAFGISVAGYPEGHPNAISEVADPTTLSATEKLRASCFDGITYCCLDADYAKEMDYLKKKIDAGAGTRVFVFWMRHSSHFFLTDTALLLLLSLLSSYPYRLYHYSNVL
jgi:methylenetetrahydrofolate reductase (NADPH)